MMDRRKLIGNIAAWVAAVPAWAPSAGARVSDRLPWLDGGKPNAKPGDDATWNAFVSRLRELGFAEGGNLVIEQRFAEGRAERYVDFAVELVKLDADVVVATSGTAARAVLAASRTMPIVTTAVPDPVRSGLVASLARPGGQVTGISNLADDLVPKRLELLKASVPAAGEIGFARCPDCMLTAGASAAEVSALKAANESAARSLGVKLVPLDVNAKQDFDAVAATLRRRRPDALLIGATPINVALRDDWLAIAAELRLPMLAPYREFGAMLSYGPNVVAIYRRAAEFVVRVLQGTHPGDLPMEQPTKFEFVVNLQIAKSIGITIPPSVLLRADDVIR